MTERDPISPDGIGSRSGCSRGLALLPMLLSPERESTRTLPKDNQCKSHGQNQRL